jgi:hypothetical protein
MRCNPPDDAEYTMRGVNILLQCNAMQRPWPSPAEYGAQRIACNDVLRTFEWRWRCHYPSG